MAMHLTCNQEIIGSSPIRSSTGFLRGTRGLSHSQAPFQNIHGFVDLEQGDRALESHHYGLWLNVRTSFRFTEGWVSTNPHTVHQRTVSINGNYRSLLSFTIWVQIPCGACINTGNLDRNAYENIL